MLRKLRQHIQSYFGFSKAETNGFLILIPLMAFMLFLPGIYSRLFSMSYESHEADQKLIDSLVTVWNSKVTYSPEPASSDTSGRHNFKRFVFDPNTISVEEMGSLGIPKFLARRIARYREAGGKFRTGHDLTRIYDFPDSLFLQLKDYIQIPGPTASDHRNSLPATPSGPGAPSGPRQTMAAIDLNEADTTMLKQLRGIGSVYSRRIIKYRELLGGFERKEQLREVYGISEAVYAKIADRIFVKEGFIPKRLNINIATFKELNRHPYITYEQTKDILNSRSKNGKFKTIDDLKKIMAFDSIQLHRLLPYLSY